MRATVHRLHSPDVDLDAYSPQDPADVGVLVQIMAGPEGRPGEESFDLIVCTPRWLERAVQRDGPTVGRHHLLIARWDAGEVRSFLTAAVQAEQAPTWQELAARIGRIGRWEFEDYQP